MSDREAGKDEDEDDENFSALLRRAFALPSARTFGESVDISRCAACGATLPGRRAQCPACGGPMQPAGDPRVGEAVAGVYRVLERLGGGGVGTVYRARHRTLGHEVAIKYLRPEFAHQAEHRSRLEREARIMSRFQHQHVVGIVDFAIAPNGSPVLIMEYLRGETLARAIARGALAEARAAHIARQIARALVRAHQLGVLHRDVKPSNVLLCEVGGDPDFVKLLDFGIARSPTTLGVTHSRDVVGTPQYMSPEQAARRPLSPASDLYSLGCVLFEMLAGSPPFDGSPAIVMHAQMNTAPPELREVAPQVSSELSAVVMRLLQKAPQARFRDARQLLLALDAAAPRVPVATGGGAGPPPALGDSPPLRAALLDDELERRLQERRDRLERAARERFDGSAPADVGDRLAVIAAALRSVGSLRTRLCQAFDEFEGRQAEPRARLSRLRAALAALWHDEKREAERARVLRAAELEALDNREAALEGLKRLAHDGLASPYAGERLDDGRARELEALVGAARRSVGSASELMAARQACASQDERRQDLRFQIEQLQGRIAALEAEIRGEMDGTFARTATLEDRYRSQLEAAASALDELVRRWPERDAGT